MAKPGEALTQINWGAANASVAKGLEKLRKLVPTDGTEFKRFSVSAELVTLGQRPYLEEFLLAKSGILTPSQKKSIQVPDDLGLIGIYARANNPGTVTQEERIALGVWIFLAIPTGLLILTHSTQPIGASSITGTSTFLGPNIGNFIIRS